MGVERTKSMRRRRSRVANWVFFTVLLTVVGSVSWYSYDKSRKEARWKLQDYQAVESVYVGDLQLSVLASATLHPFEIVQVRPEASGKVEELFFDVGDWVNEGDPLLRLDQEDLLTRLETARATLRQAQANLEGVLRGYHPRELQTLQANIDAAELALSEAQDNLARVQNLYERGFASEVELENALNTLERARQARDAAVEALNVLTEGSTPDQIEAAQAAVDLAAAGVREAENALGDATIYAPMSGVVLDRNVSEGSIIVSSLIGLGTGDVVCSIGDLSRMKAVASVDENDIGSVRVGLRCTLDVDAYPDEVFEGTVLKIHPQATIQGGVTAFVTEVEVPNSDRRLMSGMTCEVEIITKVMENVLLVPDRAITQRDGRNYVFVVGEDRKIEAREIQIGETNYDVTQVISGLQEGEQVIVRAVPSDLLDEVLKDSSKEESDDEGSGARVTFSSR